MVRGQIQSLTSQFNEISLTIEALASQDADRAVYRALGGILLEVDDRDALKDDLESSRDTIESHLKTLNSREAEIRSEYAEAVESQE